MNTATEILNKNQLHNTFWGKKIVAAEKRGGFTESNKIRSAQWINCACGKSSSIITYDGYEPSDYELNCLGNDFTAQVYNDEFKLAAETLVAIESRATQLLLKEEADKP